MTLLKLVDDSGPIGLINWYALHPTAMNYYNRLVSGDHKGYASLMMERRPDPPHPIDYRRQPSASAIR
ncbi:MAG: neutral/alkaline non-lysosomal ceramidase N-terminal domain-containing protein [Halioglobus sp.]|nr:neutral/alkaline non-lysosomal ceramidase N-terminal domain-containing protein [Halioglobus sp.]